MYGGRSNIKNNEKKKYKYIYRIEFFPRYSLINDEIAIIAYAKRDYVVFSTHVFVAFYKCIVLKFNF